MIILVYGFINSLIHMTIDGMLDTWLETKYVHIEYGVSSKTARSGFFIHP